MENNQEEYFPHPIYVNYEASRNGTIRNRDRGKYVGTVNNSGYLRFSLCDQGETKTYYNHRFIAEIFVGDIPRGFAVDHKNRDKKDNNVENLKIVTPRENSLNGNPQRSKNNIPRPVTARYEISTENFIVDFPSINSAAVYFNIKHASVQRAADGVISATYSDKFSVKISFSYT